MTGAKRVKKVEEYKENNLLHRLDGPAFLEWESAESREAGEPPIIEWWYKYGMLHRIDGPAYLLWESAKSRMNNEPPIRESWRVKGELHRVDGPALRRWDTAKSRADGNPPYYKAWHANNKRHRVDGPAVIRKKGKEWWLNGTRYADEGEHLEATFPRGMARRGLCRIEEAAGVLLERIEGL